jgi:hypothetical protein
VPDGRGRERFGIICKMVSYNFQETKTLTTSLDFRMVIDTAMLGFSFFV